MIDVVVQRLRRHGVIYNRDIKSLSKFLILKARDAFRQDPPPQLSVCISKINMEGRMQGGWMGGREAFTLVDNSIQSNDGLHSTFESLACLVPPSKYSVSYLTLRTM